MEDRAEIGLNGACCLQVLLGQLLLLFNSQSLLRVNVHFDCVVHLLKQLRALEQDGVGLVLNDPDMLEEAFGVHPLGGVFLEALDQEVAAIVADAFR